jgi:hypothetical protein
MKPGSNHRSSRVGSEPGSGLPRELSAPRRHGGAHAPAQNAWREGQHSHTVLVWCRRARGHKWPESSARARRGSTAARRPATRQGGSTAHPNAVGAKTEQDSRRKERDKVAAVLLTSGRRWSRGRLGGEVDEGEVEVHAGGRPPRLLLLVPSWFTSFPFRRGAASPWRVDGVPAVKWSLPPVRSSAPSSTGAARRRRARSFPQSSAHGRWWKRKPQEGVGGFDSVPHRPAPFESKPRAARGGKALHALGRSPGGAGGARGGARVRLGCSVGRGRSVNSLSPRSHPVPRARTGPRRACRLGSPAAPRLARAGAARPAALARLGVLAGW